MKKILGGFLFVGALFLCPNFGLMAAGKGPSVMVKIEHPTRSYEDPKPLVIHLELTDSQGNTESQKMVCQPLLWKQYDEGGKGLDLDEKLSFQDYFDAFELPDHSGFVIYEMQTQKDEEENFRNLAFYRYVPQEKVQALPAHGGKIYFSKDGNRMATLSDNPQSQSVQVHYYDLKSGEFVNSFEQSREYFQSKTLKDLVEP